MFFRLNAPSGARCFLTVALRRMDPGGGGLMHRVVLGAFWRGSRSCRRQRARVLMHLLVLGAFWR